MKPLSAKGKSSREASSNLVVYKDQENIKEGSINGERSKPISQALFLHPGSPIGNNKTCRVVIPQKLT